MIIHHFRSFVIYTFSVRCDYISTNFTANIHDTAIAVHGIFKVHGSIVVFAFIGITPLLELHDPFHQRVIQVELEVFVI